MSDHSRLEVQFSTTLFKHLGLLGRVGSTEKQMNRTGNLVLPAHN